MSSWASVLLGMTFPHLPCSSGVTLWLDLPNEQCAEWCVISVHVLHKKLLALRFLFPFSKRLECGCGCGVVVHVWPWRWGQSLVNGTEKEGTGIISWYRTTAHLWTANWMNCLWESGFVQFLPNQSVVLRSSAAPGNLLEMQNLRLHLRAAEL